MALLHSNQGNTGQLASITHRIDALLVGIRAVDVRDFAQSLASTNDGSRLAGRSLNMLDQVQQLVSIQRTGLHIRSLQAADHATKSSISGVQVVTGKGGRSSLDQVVEINTASQHTVQFLVNLDSAELGVDGNVLTGLEALTADALRTLGDVSNSQQNVLLGMENVGVAQRQVTILNKLGEELVALQTLFADLLNGNLDDAEQAVALTIAHSLQINSGLAAVSLNQGLAQNFLAVGNAVLLAQSAKIAIDCKVNKLVINFHGISSLNGKAPPVSRRCVTLILQLVMSNPALQRNADLEILVSAIAPAGFLNALDLAKGLVVGSSLNSDLGRISGKANVLALLRLAVKSFLGSAEIVTVVQHIATADRTSLIDPLSQIVGAGLIIEQLLTGNQDQVFGLGLSGRCSSLIDLTTLTLTQNNQLCIINRNGCIALINLDTLQQRAIFRAGHIIQTHNSMLFNSHNKNPPFIVIYRTE
nr:MAG TPA: hypothetical protein [Caudoviricetes sp.]